MSTDTTTTPQAHNPPGFSARMEARLAAMRFGLLAKFPHLRAEAIADHYLKLAGLAMDLRAATDLRRRTGSSPALDCLIDRCVNDIADQHRQDFGIELAWPTDSRDQPTYEHP